MSLLFGDYTELVLTAYEERNPDKLPLLTHLTTANIKRECLNVYTERMVKNGKEEEYTLRLFFGVPSSGRTYAHVIRTCSADKFRSLQSLLRRETKNPSLANVELLAWLIDFTPRPLARAQSLLKKVDGRFIATIPLTDAKTSDPEPETKPDNIISTNDAGTATAFVNAAGALEYQKEEAAISEEMEPVQAGKKKKENSWNHWFKTAFVAVLVTAITMGGAYFFWPDKGKNESLELRNTIGIEGDDSNAQKKVVPPEKDSQVIIPPVKKDKQIKRCQAITKKGTQCKRAAGESGYCWQHNK